MFWRQTCTHIKQLQLNILLIFHSLSAPSPCIAKSQLITIVTFSVTANNHVPHWTCWTDDEEGILSSVGILVPHWTSSPSNTSLTEVYFIFKKLLWRWKGRYIKCMVYFSNNFPTNLIKEFGFGSEKFLKLVFVEGTKGKAFIQISSSKMHQVWKCLQTPPPSVLYHT